jgi:DNA-binding CsgD family transcriptional regulator
MAHIAIFLKILAIPFGVVAVFLLFQNYDKYNHKYLQIYGYLAGLIFFIMMLTMTLFYIFANLFPRLSQPAVIVETIYCFFTSTAFILQCYLFFLLSRHLLQKQDPGKFGKIFYVTGGLFTAIVLYFSFYSILASDVWPVSNVSVLLIFLTNYFNIGVLIALLVGARNLPDKGKQTAVRRFAAYIVTPYTMAMVLFIFHMLWGLSTKIFSIFTDFYRLVFYGLPIFYLKRFMEMYYGVLEVAVPDKQEQLEKLCDKYNISKREREILQLICEGKTNKQIEDHLYISISTVKEHVSKIYKKTGVKNRVQLNNLFRIPRK